MTALNLNGIGILLKLTDKYVEFWIQNYPRLKILRQNAVINKSNINIGEWIQITYDITEKKFFFDKPILKYLKRLPHIYLKNKAVCINVNFIPLNWYLYPQSSQEKNLRMAGTLEIGNVPIVFKNNFMLYVPYNGVAQITLNSTSIEKKLEKLYKTPWLIQKNEYNYSLYCNLQHYLPSFIGKVVEQFNKKLYIYNENCCATLYKTNISDSNIVKGDIIAFLAWKIFEENRTKTLAIACEQILPNVSRIIKKEFSINTEQRCDSRIKNFCLTGSLKTDENTSSTSNLILQKTECVVVNKSNNLIQVFAIDPSFKNSTATYNSSHINPLPEVGEWIVVFQNCISAKRKRNYVLHSVKKLDEPKFQYRISSGRLNLRVTATVSQNKLYHTSFGTIIDPLKKLNISMMQKINRLSLWCFKLDQMTNGNFWAIAHDPDFVWQADSPTKYLNPSNNLYKLSEKKTLFVYTGSKYRNESENTNNYAKLETTKEIYSFNNYQARKKKNIETQCQQYNISNKKIQNLYSNKDVENCNENEKNKKHFKLNKKLVNSFQEKFINVIDSNVLEGFIYPKTEMLEEDVVLPYKISGVVVSMTQLSNKSKDVVFYIYSNNISNNGLAYLLPEYQNHTILHGNWINFDVKYCNKKCIVTNYTVQSPLLPTRTIRNTIELIVEAFVPKNYNPNQSDSCIVHSDFVPNIYDKNRFVTDDMLNKYIKIIIQRCKPTDSLIGWKIITILKIKAD